MRVDLEQEIVVLCETLHVHHKYLRRFYPEHLPDGIAHDPVSATAFIAKRTTILIGTGENIDVAATPQHVNKIRAVDPELL